MELLLSVIILFLVFYYFFLVLVLIAKFKGTKQSQMPFEQKFISVIVSAKNEEKNISGLIRSLVSQTYPLEKYEIIIVDDYSTDSTRELILKASNELLNLRYIDNRNNPSMDKGKKSALTYGISQSNGEIILLTDADCRPGKDWITSVTSQFDSEISAVIGFSPFAVKKGFFNTFIRYENIKSSFLMSVFYFIGLPYLSFGRNFAYRRSVFEMIRGFTSINHSLSGDDDLFLQRLRKSGKNIQLTSAKDSIVFSEPADSIKKYFRQKTRHLSASKYYPMKLKFLLGAYYIGNLFLTITFLVSILFSRIDLALLSLPKFLLDVVSISYTSRKISSSLSPLQIIFGELAYTLFYPIVGVLSRRKNIRW
ncbi:MAG: glycosyltransferase [Ignavibacteria bacterium]|nr:glycosyltransferase [Ignavibacteria bacterium]